MNLSKLISVLGLVFGLLLLFAGIAFIFIYFKDAIFMRFEEADQSLIFWYLPFLFVGLGSLICGIVIDHSSLSRLNISLFTTKKISGEYEV